MRGVVAGAVVVALFGGAARAQQAPRLRWDREGIASLAAAAAEARAAGRRLLLGLSGSPT